MVKARSFQSRIANRMFHPVFENLKNSRQIHFPQPPGQRAPGAFIFHPVIGRSCFNLRLILFLLLLLLVTALPGLAQESDKLALQQDNFRIFYSPQNEKTAAAVARMVEFHRARLEAFYGLQIAETASIIIAASPAEFREYGDARLPEWSSAAYILPENLILVKSPAWAGSLPQLERDFLHELSHLYFHQKFAALYLPLWYNEGLAEYLGGRRLEMADEIKLSAAVFSGKTIPLERIDSLLYFPQPKAELAYLQSLSAVLLLKETLDREGVGWGDFHELVLQAGWAAALQQSTGMDEFAFEEAWLRALEKNYRWLFFLNIDTLLWLILGVVFILSIYLIRRRNKKRLRRWEEQERRGENFY